MLTSTKRTLCFITTLTVCVLLIGCPFLADLKLAPATVPDVVGMLRSAAEEAILTATLCVSRVYDQYNPYVEADVIIAQNPLGGTVVEQGDGVDLVRTVGPLPCWDVGLGGGRGHGFCVEQTSDGGFAVAGYLTGGPSTSGMYVMKADANGTLSWAHRIEGTKTWRGCDMEETSDGGYILVALGSDIIVPWCTMCLVRIDLWGNETWYKYIADIYSETGGSVSQTSDGGYLIAADSFSDSTDRDMCLVKTNSSGIVLWSNSFGGPDRESVIDMQLTEDGGCILAGWIEPSPDTDLNVRDAFVVKVDATGNEEWSRTYGGEDWEVVWSVQQTDDGGYVLAGNTHPHPYRHPSGQVYLVRIDAAGEEIWTRTYGGPGGEVAYSVKQTSDGGFIVAGATVESPFSEEEPMSPAYVVKTDAHGNETWSAVIGKLGLYRAQDIIETSAGEYVLTGKTDYDYRGRTGIPLIGWSFPAAP